MKAVAATLLVVSALACASAFHETFDAGWDARWIHSSEFKKRTSDKIRLIASSLVTES